MKKTCENKACSMTGIKVETEAKDCLGCGKPLKADDVLADLFGWDPAKAGRDIFDDVFRKK